MREFDGAERGLVSGKGLLELCDRVTGRRLWRVTHDAEVSHVHRYFNVPAFSANGRWLAVIRGEQKGWGSQAFELRDLGTGEVVQLEDAYGSPTWNTRRNEFYWMCGEQLWGLDCDTGERRVLLEWDGREDMLAPWSVDRTGRWLLGSNTLTLDDEARACMWRLDLERPGRAEKLYEAPELGCSFHLVRANPAHHLVRLLEAGQHRTVAVDMVRQARLLPGPLGEVG